MTAFDGVPAEEPIELPRAKLLLVDDRRENLLALEAVLEPLGADMVKARSGAEALKHLLTDDFAVILLDVQMPDMDGFETAALIKERERSRHIPIIFVTAINKEDRYAFRGYTAGAVDYLTKPIDPDILRSKVSVFIELYRKTQQLRLSEQREAERRRQLEAVERERQFLTELSEREAQLSQFKATLDATLDAVFLFDPSTLKFFYVNQGAVSLLGYSEEEIRELTPVDIDASEDREHNLRVILSALQSGTERAHKYETRARHKSGRTVPVEAMTQYVAPPGGRARYVTIVRDISERKRQETELERLYERERRIAEALQQSIVKQPPEDLFPGIALETLYQAAWDDANIGGDYLDVFGLEGGKVALIVGDVSGKGLAAAARTAEVKYALRAYLREQHDPAKAMMRLNGLLCNTAHFDAPDVENAAGFGAFICVAAAVLDPTTGDGMLATAGAEPPLIVRRDGAVESQQTAGIPLGVDESAQHESAAITLGRGDSLILVTDGITEARRGRDFFGYEGMERVAQQNATAASPQQMARAIMEAAKEFSGGHLRDDACLLVATRR